MKVLHYVRKFRKEDGGIVRAVRDHITLSTIAGDFATLATVDWEDAPETWTRSDNEKVSTLKIKPVMRNRLLGFCLSLFRLSAKIRSSDIVYLHEIWRPENIALALICRWWRVPYIVPIYGMLSHWATDQKEIKKKLFHRLVGKAFLENARFIQCVNHQELDQAKPWAPLGCWVVLPYLVDPTLDVGNSNGIRELRSKQRSPRVFRFLFLSRLHPKKGVDQLLGAVAILATRGVKFELVVAGTGTPHYTAQLKDRAASLGVAQYIQWTGSTFGDAKVAAFRDADCFVLPTLSDNFGIVLLEAMASGLPVITTNKVDIWSGLLEGGASICEVTAEELAAAMNKMVARSAKELLEISERGAQWVSQAMCAENLVASYQQLHLVSRTPRKTGEIYLPQGL